MIQSASRQKTPPHQVTFSFGKNWSQFSYTLTDSQINQATHELKNLVGSSINGKFFLDIGCGSGLSSLASHRLGASSIYSFDYDIYSVTTTKAVCAKYAAQANWKIWQDSILTPSVVGKFDVVYS